MAARSDTDRSRRNAASGWRARLARLLSRSAKRGAARRIADRRKDATMRSLFEKSIAGVVIADADGRIDSINAAAAAMFGYDADALQAVSLATLMPELAAPSDAAASPLRTLAGSARRELIGRRAGGASFLVEVTASEVRDEYGSLFVAFVNDVTFRRQQEQQLEFRADHDALTGLPNRMKFARELEADVAAARAAGRIVAVYLLDLDRFKEVNDTLGHAVGDRLLQDVGRRLAGLVPEDGLLSRFGGDEFAIYLSGVGNFSHVEDFAYAVLACLKQPFEVDQIALEVGGSLGAATFPDDGASVDDLLQRADIAMYSAKRNQTGFARYWAEDDAHSIRNLTLTGDLRRAIDEGDINLAFQPKIDLRSGRLVGAEVLARWHRAAHGTISPDEFIVHAEQSGLIFPLTQWVLGKAVECAAVWRALGWDLNIAVNLSPRLLHHEQILSMVTEMLNRWEYPADRLTIEITENALLVNPAHAMIVINELAELGIRVSIDDFGTGYSSLSYLATLPAAELKIDMSFILGMEASSQNRTIIRSVVAMAHDLDLQVVAEGVETREAMEALRLMGCDVGQGFLFGRPMEMAEFESWLKTVEWGNGGRNDSIVA
jgi:diguanylate cyclase (GGDEF)-like protein/PAS domain S-box-containing protein